MRHDVFSFLNSCLSGLMTFIKYAKIIRDALLTLPQQRKDWRRERKKIPKFFHEFFKSK